MNIISRLADHWHTALVVTVIVGLLAWNAHLAAQLRPGAKAPPQQPNAVICTNCGWQGWRVTLELPQRCPKCHKMTVHFAGICPKCGEWTPWNIAREQLLYAEPQLFMQKGPGWFFPRCRKCGSPTNATGAPFPTTGFNAPDAE
jgi:hypothetical protein